MCQQRIQQPVEGGVFFRGRREDFRFGLDEPSGDEFVPGVCRQDPDGFRRGFKVELQADGRTDLKGLVFTNPAAGKPDGAGRQVERLAVPLEDFGRLRKTEDGGIPVRFAGDGEPADFFFRPGIDAGAEGTGQELCAEAHAQHRPAGGDEAANEILFGREPGKGGLVMHAHGAAHDNEQIGGGGPGQFGVFEKAGGGEAETGAAQPRFEGGGTFEGHVLENLGS